MFFSTFIPAAFPALALAHFVALLSPGQDFFLIAGHAIRNQLKGSKYICLGVAVGNAVYIAIAIIGWTGIRDNTQIFSVIKTVGALYLIWIGAQLLASKPCREIGSSEHKNSLSVLRQFLLGLNSALLNPKNALFYISLMTAILGSRVTLIQQIISGVWMFLVVLTWDILLAVMLSQTKIQYYLQHSVHLFERGAGVILISLGVALFI